MTPDLVFQKSLRTFLNRYHAIFFFLIISISAGISFYLFEEIAYLLPLWITAIGFGSYYLAVWITSADAIFEKHDRFLMINLYAKNLNINRTLNIQLSDIRGFSLDQITRGSHAILIYLNDSSYLKFSVLRHKEALELEAYLSTFLIRLSKDTHPKFKNFSSAYLYAMKRVFPFLVITIVLTFLIVSYLHFSNPATFVICTVLNLICWFIMVRNPVKKAFFRFGAFYFFSNLFIYLSPLLAIVIWWKVAEIRSEPLRLSKPHELITKRPNLFYRFDYAVTNPNVIIASNYLISKNLSSKKKTFSVTHYFTTPLSSVDSIRINGRYNIWLLKTFKQEISKSLTAQLKFRLIQDYHVKTKEKFKNLFSRKPNFYKQNFKDLQATQLLYGNVNAANVNYILIPHWESLQIYKNNELKEVTLFFAAITILNLVGCIFIAINR